MSNPLNVESSTRETHEFLTVSNLLSVARAVLAIPFALVMLSDLSSATMWGIVILAVAALTDKLDGAFARKYDQVTDWGKILDPLADKIGIGVVALVLVKLDLIPLWFVLAIIARDVLILLGGICLRSQTRVIPMSNQLGKWTIGMLGLTMLMAMLRLNTTIVDACVWMSLTMLSVSFVLYAKIFVRHVTLKN